MPASMDADKSDPGRVERLQLFTVPNGYQPVFGAVDDIGMAIHFPDPTIGTEMITEHISYRQDGEKAFYHFQEIVIWRIEDQESGVIIGCDPGSEPATDAPAINDDMLFFVLNDQAVVHELHIGQHFLLTAFPGALAESAVIDHYQVVIVAVEIACIFCPAFDAAGIAVEIEDQSLGSFAEKMQAVDLNARRNIEEQFFEGNIVTELKIGRESFRFENEFFLYEPGDGGEADDAADNIPDKVRQPVFVSCL